MDKMHLVEIFDLARVEKSKFIYIVVFNRLTNEKELIIFGQSNLENKFYYITNHYDDDLKLNEFISIVDCGYTNDLSEIGEVLS